MSGENDLRSEETSREMPVESETMFDLLSNRRRRTLLRILSKIDIDTVECSSLATEIVEREGGDFTVERDLVLIELHHRHLPKLADVGVVEYDHQNNVVHCPDDEEIAALVKVIA